VARCADAARDAAVPAVAGTRVSTGRRDERGNDNGKRNPKTRRHHDRWLRPAIFAKKILAGIVAPCARLGGDLRARMRA
jgi:hypothetical protein